MEFSPACVQVLAQGANHQGGDARLLEDSRIAPRVFTSSNGRLPGAGLDLPGERLPDWLVTE